MLKMSYLVVLCIALAAATASSPLDRKLDDEWVMFKKTFQKAYDEKEEYVRRYIWEENVRYVMEHNVRYDLGLHTFTLGINEYADLTPEEYRKYLLGYRMPDKKNKKKYTKKTFKRSGLKLPGTVDWRQKGYVTAVKNQGRCGSCWAFSSTGSLEGQHFRRTGKLVSLSEQNLIDCTRKYGNAGCNGGWMDNAFRYIKDNNGIDLESDYPYEARDDTCRYEKSGKGATDIGFRDIEAGSESALQEAAATQGPISVAIDATHRSFQLYRHGVYDEPKCNASKLDHAVLVVGYGTGQDTDYWLVKNSWGTSWGDKGYIKMSRNKKDQCGIATHASYPEA